jgi:hypothetical protein
MQRILIVLALVAFASIETALLLWCLQTYTVAQVFEEFFDPMSLVILVDFVFFGGIVFLWMVADARGRGHNAWKWLPLYIFCPTLALFLYLIVRKPLAPASQI